MPDVGAKPDFFRYLSPAGGEDIWGLSVSAAGSYHSPRGAAYPPTGHPMDHGFTWEGGRILGSYQILLLVAGGGEFESVRGGRSPIRAGQALILFPNVWHRYRPDPHTGWHEQWIELRGPALQRLERAGLIRDRDPMVDVAPDGGAIEALFHRILEAVRASGPRPEPLAAAWAMEILARLQAPRERLGLPAPIALAVHRAEAQLAENSGRPLPLRKLAQDLGFAYSYFRREFKASTGVSPGQYARRLRLERARRLLGSAPDSVKSIADQLGFSSEFHFSAAFKRTFGVSPAKWRAEARRAAIARRGESASSSARPG